METYSIGKRAFTTRGYVDVLFVIAPFIKSPKLEKKTPSLLLPTGHLSAHRAKPLCGILFD